MNADVNFEATTGQKFHLPFLKRFFAMTGYD